jgi:ABC-2 type transport system ATP-binding protein
VSGAPTAIRVTGLEKTFRIPEDRTHTLKERALHPLRRQRFHELNVLHGVSFEVVQGEFFGIVGRNGSGKSTLLKCLAGIYRADEGKLEVAGRLSPFIELGVGFNPDLPARDNVEINAIMMGLNPKEARARFDEIIAFGELEGFVDQKLKNYSSGMQVRLAFSVMVHSDPDVMLIDEVLAVGDAAFQQKCLDVFYRLRAEGKTIVLVTHAMSLVEQFCHRAMMLSDGDVTMIGDPGEVGRAYLSENFRSSADDLEHAQGPSAQQVRVLDAWMTDGEGRRVETIAYHEPMVLHVSVQALAPIRQPGIVMWVTNEDRVRVFSIGARENGDALGDLEPGEQIDFAIETHNPLSAGRYFVGCSVTQGSAGLDVLLYHERVTEIVSFGVDMHGVVGIPHASSITRTRSGEVVR